MQQGSVNPADFDLIAERWLADTELQHWLAALQLPPEPQRKLTTLSGGQLMRLRLAKAFRSGNFLLLDEVSNHLDLNARQWLAQQLRQYQPGFLLVSHDQLLLNEVRCIYQLAKTGLSCYQGNYTDFMARQQQEQQQRLHQTEQLKQQLKHQQQQTHILRQQQAGKHQQAKKARANANQAKILLDFKQQQAQSSQRRLKQDLEQKQQQLATRLADLQQPEDWRQWPRLTTADIRPRKYLQLSASDLVLPYGNQQSLSFQWWSNDHILLSGDNGSGKSSLLQILHGQLMPHSGQFKTYGSLWYLDQQLSLLQQENTVLAELRRLSGQSADTLLRTALANTGFSAAQACLQVAKLSGGEQLKLLLVAYSLQSEPAFLLLDEPDNHLDFQAKAMLLSFLQQYQGGFVLVSHQPVWYQPINFSQQLAL
ncbi:ATP-binding cassette domain-containing protein [Chromatiaceae bacterium AAb-1]|nr:ATP-binding cassette domain-containing protein [Chromatiaceae bacterium AAb-1]